MNLDTEYPIQAVARMTGLTPHVIRVWERRYGTVAPRRTDTNRRLYTHEHVEKLRLLKRAIDQGHAIGQIAGHTPEQLHRLLAASLDESEPSGERHPQRLAPPPGSDADPLLHELLQAAMEAVKALDALALEETLARAEIRLSRPHLLEKMILPLLYEVGSLWREGELRVAHEHLATAAVRTLLGSYARASSDAFAPVILVTTPAGQLHELGALFAAVTATSQGWRTLYLGPNLPAEEIAAAAILQSAKAVALSITYPGDDPRVAEELKRLRERLPGNIAVVAGGRASSAYETVLIGIGALRAESLSDFKRLLDELRDNRSGEGG